MLSLGITTDVGVNVPFNSQTGDLAVELDLSGDRVTPSLPYNEFLPDSAELIETFVEQFDTILGLIDIESLSIWHLPYHLSMAQGWTRWKSLQQVKIIRILEPLQVLVQSLIPEGVRVKTVALDVKAVVPVKTVVLPAWHFISLLFFGLIRRRATE